jgi:hypothetical protein
MNRFSPLKLALPLSILGAFAMPASAVDFQGVGALGSFTGSVTYDAATNDLTLSLTNTSDPANGGFLTAFAFDLDPDVTLTISSCTLASFCTLLTDVSVAPFGTNEWGVSTSSDWLGGGSPTGGLGVGASATWIFDVDPDATSTLDVNDMLARFRGFIDGDSDKVPVTVIPEPSTYALMLAGLGVVGYMARRRQRQV